MTGPIENRQEKLTNHVTGPELKNQFSSCENHH